MCLFDMANTPDATPDGADQVYAWLEATDWTMTRLANAAGVTAGALSKAVTRRKIGRLLALELERVTRAAYDAGEVTALPLAAATLRPPSDKERERRQLAKRAKEAA